MTDDDELLSDREILNAARDPESVGYNASLSCGHEVWFAIEPVGTHMKCAECIQTLLARLEANRKR